MLTLLHNDSFTLETCKEQQYDQCEVNIHSHMDFLSFKTCNFIHREMNNGHDNLTDFISQTCFIVVHPFTRLKFKVQT